jgi:hypothetical protein
VVFRKEVKVKEKDENGQEKDWEVAIEEVISSPPATE